MGRPSQVRVIGPLAAHSAGFRRQLERLGYRPNAVCDKLRLMAHASRWLNAHGLASDDLTPARVEEFLAHRRAEGYTLWLSVKAMVPMLGYLRGLGVVPVPAPVAPATEAEQLLEDYRAYLVQERGLRSVEAAPFREFLVEEFPRSLQQHEHGRHHCLASPRLTEPAACQVGRHNHGWQHAHLCAPVTWSRVDTLPRTPYEPQSPPEWFD